jgi:hypothetical protein
VQARLGHNDLTSTTHYVWALSEESDTAAIAMNVVLGYQQEDADPQQAMMDPLVAQKMVTSKAHPASGCISSLTPWKQ